MLTRFILNFKKPKSLDIIDLEFKEFTQEDQGREKLITKQTFMTSYFN